MAHQRKAARIWVLKLTLETGPESNGKEVLEDVRRVMKAHDPKARVALIEQRTLYGSLNSRRPKGEEKHDDAS